MQEPGRARWPICLAATVLVCLVFAVFWPIADFEFVHYDVRQQLLDNPHVHGLTAENLKYILTSPCIDSYYPVRSLTFALDYELWGLDAGRFKLTNSLIHLANVLLVLWLVVRLFRHPASTDRSPRWWDLCVATFSAGVFAAHPVVVEPVVWVAGREELLMTLGALGCIHCHLTGRRQSDEGGSTKATVACHAGAAFCCAAACLSNAVAAVVPLLIVAWDVLTLARPRLWRIVYGTSALWAIGAATIVMKTLGPGQERLALGPATFSVERLMLVPKAYWLNVKTIIWPTPLAIEYPEVSRRDLPDGEVILGGIAIALTCLFLWKLRRRKLLVLGVLWFGLALGPASQIMPHHIFRADRFLYLPLVGLAVAVAMGLRAIGSHLKRRAEMTALIAVGVFGLLLLNAISAQQVQTWRDSVSVWENCLRLDPNNTIARGGLADNLAERGQFDEAIQHYRAAIVADPNDAETLKNFALLLATCRQQELRDDGLALRLAGRACELAKPHDPAAVMILAEIHAQAGRPEMAIATTEKAIGITEAAGNSELTQELRQRLKLYRNRSADGGRGH